MIESERQKVILFLFIHSYMFLFIYFMTFFVFTYIFFLKSDSTLSYFTLLYFILNWRFYLSFFTLLSFQCFLNFNFWFQCCQAQFHFSPIWTETCIIITVNSPTQPPHLAKYIWANSRLPRKVKFGTEALFNQTKSSC